MKIKMCAFIPESLGSSLRMCDLPNGLANQKSFDSDVKATPGYWLKEPSPSTVFCGTDNRDFGNIHGTNRLFAYNKKTIDLAKIGQLQQSYGSKSKLFEKGCDPSNRVFVQLSNSPLSIWQMRRSPVIHYQGGGRYAFMERQSEYGYLHVQSPMTGSADYNLDTIQDINVDYSTIEVKTGAGYPYLEPFSPNIDFDFKIHMYRHTNGYEIDIIGCHNEFPCYELFINDISVYKYRTSWHGPNPINLNKSFSFTVKKRFLR